VILDTPWTVDQASRHLRISPGSTTRRLRQIADRFGRAVLAEPAAYAASGRDDRVARAVTEVLIDMGRLFAADPAGAKRWVRQMVRQRLGTKETSPCANSTQAS